MNRRASPPCPLFVLFLRKKQQSGQVLRWLKRFDVQLGNRAAPLRLFYRKLLVDTTTRLTYSHLIVSTVLKLPVPEVNVETQSAGNVNTCFPILLFPLRQRT